MKTLFLIPVLSILAACGGAGKERPEPIIITQKVAVAVDAPCVPDTLGKAPEYVDTKDKLVAAVDAAVRLQLLYAGRAQREARLGELEPVVEGCPRGSVPKK